LLREWLKNESQHNEIVEKDDSGRSLYEKEIFELKSNRGDKSLLKVALYQTKIDTNEIKKILKMKLKLII
jgi:hypothetical protein